MFHKSHWHCHFLCILPNKIAFWYVMSRRFAINKAHGQKMQYMEGFNSITNLNQSKRLFFGKYVCNFFLRQNIWKWNNLWKPVYILQCTKSKRSSVLSTSAYSGELSVFRFSAHSWVLWDRLLWKSFSCYGVKNAISPDEIQAKAFSQKSQSEQRLNSL